MQPTQDPAGTKAGQGKGQGKARGPDGRQLFLMHCASCHGKEGKGDGTEGLEPPPRDLTSGQFSFGTSPRAITKTIQQGIPPLMQEFKSRLSDSEIKKVVGFVRKLLPREPNPKPEISTMKVTDAARITYGYLPPRKRGGMPVARGLAIGLPGGLSFEYRRDGVRLMRVFDGAFVDRVSWRGRGGQPLKLLGRRFWQDGRGDPPPRILAADRKTPLDVRFRASWRRGAEAGMEARVLDASFRPIAGLNESLRAHSSAHGRGFTRRIEFRDLTQKQRIVLRVGALSAGSVELDRKKRDAGSWREHWLVARYDVERRGGNRRGRRRPIASTFECLVVRHPRDVDATLATDEGATTLEFELSGRKSIPITTTFLRADAWSKEHMTALGKEIHR